jgi:hypothetical protein
MNDETNVELMDNDDLFFDPSDFEEVEETGDHTEETETEEAPEAEEPASEPIETPVETEEPAETPAEPAPELFDLKFLGETKQYTREEMTTLAQKGMNHDRILQQRDALQQFKSQHESVIDDLGRIAKQFGMEPADLLHSMEKNLRRQRGESDAEAEANIRAEKANRQLKAQKQVEDQQEAAKRRQQADVQAFVARYPNMDYKTIPQSVWEDVRKGETLVNAYGRYETEQLRAENQRLQQQLAVQAQNEKNKQNSLGSMKSGSATQKTDPFLEALFSD